MGRNFMSESFYSDKIEDYNSGNIVCGMHHSLARGIVDANHVHLRGLSFALDSPRSSRRRSGGGLKFKKPELLTCLSNLNTACDLIFVATVELDSAAIDYINDTPDFARIMYWSFTHFHTFSEEYLLKHEISYQLLSDIFNGLVECNFKVLSRDRKNIQLWARVEKYLTKLAYLLTYEQRS